MSDRRFFPAVAILLTAVLIGVLPAGPGRQSAAFTLLWLWPAMTWAGIQRGSPFERWSTAAGLALLLNAWLLLYLHYLPGPVSNALFLMAASAIAIAPLLWRAREFTSVTGPRFWLPAALVLFLALGLRLYNLGYSQFQGDEAMVMVRAAAALTGDDTELFLHQKGPAEILLPMATWAITGSINGTWARLPFTWASWLAVTAVMVLAQRWFGGRSGIWAGLLFALGGFGVAFGRIVQYQSLVMLWGALALLHAERYRQDFRASDLLLVALFLGGGLLAHYDTMLVVPAVAWTLFRGIQRHRGVAWLAWGGSLAAGLALVGSFYLPFALSPTLAATGRYLLGARIGAGPNGGWVKWSGPQVWQMATFYNATYTIVGLLLLTAAGLWFVAKQRKGMAAVLYLAIPLLFYTVIVADPRTHVYTIFPGATILAGYGIAQLWLRLEAAGARPGRLILGLVLAGYCLVSLHYVTLLFLDHTLERQRTWAENRPSLYDTTWDAPPRYGLFGFPHRAGWPAVSPLLRPEDYPYASNEEEEITNWYTAQAPRTHCQDFNTFILAENVQDEVPYDPAILTGLYLRHRVQVNGRATLSIYGREPIANIQTGTAGDSSYWLRPQEAVPPHTTGAFPVNVVLGRQVRLLGYDLDTSNAFPGGRVFVRLYWQALAPFAENYQVFAHLYDGQMWGQADGAPECAFNPTTHWEPGEIIPDPHVIPIQESAATGQAIPLLAGMYNLLSRERLVIPGTLENTVHLTTITLRPK